MNDNAEEVAKLQVVSALYHKGKITTEEYAQYFEHWLSWNNGNPSVLKPIALSILRGKGNEP